MVSRLMINLRDPMLHSPSDRDGAVTSHVGYVSTVVLNDTSSIVLAAQTESSPTLWSAWSVVFNWSHPYHIKPSL